jgi:hypothetical protein
MGQAGADDAFFAFVRYAPMLFVLAGIVVVSWLSRQRLPIEIQPDVLAALSETEALSPLVIRERPPLGDQNIDLKLLVSILDQLCSVGQVVRWYENVGGQRQSVYRRVNWPRAYVSPLK